MQRKVVLKSIILTLLLVLALCFVLSSCDLFSKKEYFKEETTYNLTSCSAIGFEVPDGFIDLDKSFVKFDKKGNFIMQVTPTAEAIQEANILLALAFESVFGEDHDNIAGISLSDMERYTSEVLPGESFFGLVEALTRLGDSLGLKIHGLNFDDAKVKAFFDTFKETHLIPEFTLPDDFYITIESKYGLCEIPSETQEQPFKAIYLGDYNGVDDSDPYILLTRYVTEDNKEALFVYNAILDLRIDFVVR